MTRWLALCVLLGFACCCYTPVAVRPTGPGGFFGRQPVVRVRLLSAASPVTIVPDREVAVSFGGRIVKAGAGQPVELALEDGLVLRAAGREWRKVADTVFCRAGPGAVTRVGQRRYRGDLLAFVTTEGELAVVNQVGLEDYLCGVVPCEIGPIKPETFEAVKAQAIAARSFTLTRLGKRPGLGFQLYDSYARDQEYQGVERETELGNRAVAETGGEVLLYRGQPAEALYHANCGGITQDGSQPYLRSVADTPGHRRGTPYCAGSKDFSWRASFGREDFENRLGAQVGATGRVKVRGFSVEQDKSGRAAHLRFETDRGNFRVNGSDFRLGLGLKSTLFQMALGRDSVVFAGRGWGHGSGLCQDGAIEMARKGKSYKQILAHYYSGVKPGRLY